MKLFLIRHGQSEADLLNVIECNADFNLTELGLKQANKLVNELEKYQPFDLLYSSTLKRAKTTAQLISEKFNLQLVTDSRLCEKNIGDMAGLSREEANNKYPVPEGGLKPYQKMGGGTGESLLQMEYRIKEFFSEIINLHSNKSVLVISHGGTIDMALKYLLNTNDNIIFCSGDVGFHYLEIVNNKVIVRFLNKEII